MGNCVPVQRSTDPALEFKCTDPPGKSIEIVSPVKESTVNTGFSVPELNSMTQPSSLVPFERSFRDMSNRNEMFFDSQPWLESDCEDYLSVDGDITPSCGSTPIHHGSFTETPAQDKPPYITTPPPNSTPETPPTDVKKQLIELFRESFGSDHVDENQIEQQGKVEVKPSMFHLCSKSADRSPYESGPFSCWSNETTPNIGSKVRKQRRAHTPHRCLPNLVRSFSERKKRPSPAHSVGTETKLA